MATRLRALRDKFGYSQEGMAQAVGMEQTAWSRWEKTPPEAFVTLKRIAENYDTSADYLLGLTADPSPRRDEPLPEQVRELLQLSVELPADRQEELLGLARVLYTAEQKANVREYRRLRALVLRLPDGARIAAIIDDALRLAETGDLAAAWALVDAHLVDRPAEEALEDRSEQI
jgi:transcriptional regulator with XRE-family HTH domain